MPDKTYIVRFVKLDSSVEVWEHVKREDAKVHFDLFNEDDKDIYSEIDLIERDWLKNEDVVLEVKRF